MSTYRDQADEIATLRQELATSEAACASAMAEVEALREERDNATAEVEALKAARLLSVLFGHHKGAPKPFALQRRNGRALVALGAEFPDGAVALRLADDGGWTTVSTGGAEQFSDPNTEILWLSDELESLAAMEAERDALRLAATHLVQLVDHGADAVAIGGAIPALRRALDGGGQ